MPKISIIVPVYNVENYLKQCLDSLINQTLRDIEIICVNDGSTDNSLNILKDYFLKDERIKVFDQPNQGQSAVRNFAMNQAQGEYIGFVDSDDWVDLDYYEKLYNAAKEYDCDIACAGYKRCGKIKKSVRKSFKEIQVLTEIHDKIIADNLPKDNYVTNKIYKRVMWENSKITFPVGRWFEDMAIMIQVLNYSGKMVTVPDIYYNYRKNPNSTINSTSPKRKEDFLWARNEMYSFAEKHKIKLKERKDYDKKEYFKFFGITVLKVYHKDNVTKYKLFGFIPFITKSIV